MSKSVVAAMVGSNKIPHGPLRALLTNLHKIQLQIFFFFFYVGCPGQLTRITTISHGLLDILQAQEQVRYRGSDRRAHRESNPKKKNRTSPQVTRAARPSSATGTDFDGPEKDSIVTISRVAFRWNKHLISVKL